MIKGQKNRFQWNANFAWTLNWLMKITLKIGTVQTTGWQLFLDLRVEAVW